MAEKSGSPQWGYTYAELRVTSALSIPEWAVFESEVSLQPDVTISLGTEPPNSSPVGVLLAGSSNELPDMDGEKFVSRVINAEEYLFHAPNAGVYRVRQGREIQIFPAAGAGEHDIRLFLLGSAWGALCYQRGRLALHASVVAVAGKGMAFCGASGAGKSSTAAWLVRHGYPLVSDDLCCITLPPAGAPLVYPSTPRLKLWNDALNAMGWQNLELERDYVRMEKYHLTHLPGCQGFMPDPIPMGAIYLLKRGEPAITRLSGLQALQRLITAATYRPDLLEPMGQLAAHWQRCAQLIRHIPVYELACPREWSALETILQQLTASWLV